MQLNKLFILTILIFSLNFIDAATINGCTNITSSDSYVLTGNITGANNSASYILTNACILISISNVSLDCAGYSITNNQAGNTSGIQFDGSPTSPLTNITVTNCRAYDYTWGIYLYESNSSFLTTNTAQLSANIGFVLHNSSYISITNNTASNNYGDAFSLNSSSYNTLTNNTVYNNSQGFVLHPGSSYNLLINNTAYNLSWTGFYLINASHNNFTSNTAYNTTNGFYLYQDSSSNIMTGNTIYNNSVGFYATGVILNVFANNTAYDNHEGFYLEAGSSNNNLSDNIAYGNNYSGFYIINSTYNTLTSNTAYNNSQSGFFLHNNSNFNNLTNNIAYNNSWVGFYLYSSNENILVNNNASNNTEYGFEIYLSSGNNVSNNIAQENEVFDLYADPLSWYILSEEPAYDIYCNNIIENNTGSGGRPINYTNTSVNWSNIEASEIILCNADNSNLTNVTVHGSDNTPNNGLIMTRTENTTIDSSNSSGNIVGFFVLYSNGNNFTNNIAQQDLAVGFYLLFSTGNNLISNIESNASEAGFAILVCNNTNLTNNIAYNNNYYGILLQESSDVHLTNNTVYNSSSYGVVVEDSNRTVITGDHYYGNTPDLQVDNTAGFYPADGFLITPPTVINLSKVIFDNPAGDFTSYTNISINDVVENSTLYTIRWAPQFFPVLPNSSSSFRDKYIVFDSPNSNVSLDTITWHWLDSETSGYNESNFSVWKGTLVGGWERVPRQSLDTNANQITVLGLSRIGDIGEFGLFEAPVEAAPTPPSGGGWACGSGLNISLVQVICPDNKIIIRVAGTDNKPLGAGQMVVVKGAGSLYSERTDTNGEVSFTLPASGRYTATAYAIYCTEYSFDYELCKAGCQSNDSCSTNQYCDKNTGLCKSVECGCGEVYGHLCHPYECCADIDCNKSYVCTNHQCKPVSEKPECTINDDCKQDEYCSSGKCKIVQVEKCGYILNHTWINYECCNNSDCQTNYICTEHACALLRIITNASGFIGDSHKIQVLPEDEYNLTIADPKGERRTIQTDKTGNAILALENIGEYSISVIRNEVVAANVTVNALNKTVPAEKPTTPTQDLCLPGAIIIILLIAAIYLLYRKNKNK